MCEIQILAKFGKNATVNKNDVKQFFHMLTLGSFSNRDAYGIFTKGYVIKKPIPFADEKDERKAIAERLIGNARFIVGHNRLATQGDKHRNFNNHPFPTKDWVVVHNGVLTNDRSLCEKYGLEYKAETDSAVVVELLQHLYDKKTPAIQCITKVAEELGGRYSIVAYNKKEDRLFYFKDAGTEFTFRLFEFDDGNKILCGSTSHENFDLLYTEQVMNIFYGKTFKQYYQIDADEETIFEITSEEIKKVGYFTTKKFSSTSWNGQGFSNYEDSWEGGITGRKDNYPGIGGALVPLEERVVTTSRNSSSDAAHIQLDADAMVEMMETITDTKWNAVVDLDTKRVLFELENSDIQNAGLYAEMMNHSFGLKMFFPHSKGVTVSISSLEDLEREQLAQIKEFIR